ncbi:MAG: hypothetical protein WAS54_04755 [Scrofimicrobium sp.]
MRVALVGTPGLLKALIKQDLRRFAPWIAIVTALSVSSVLVYPWVFPTQADRASFAAVVGANPALGIIFGPAFDLSTADGFNSWRALALGGFFTALASIFAVTSATRRQEDTGQAELLASGVLGRGSRLLAGVSLAMVGSLLIGIVSGLLTVAFGGGWNASLLLAATFTATGWMFAGVAAITAQIGSEARSSNSMAVGTLGVLFLLRGLAYSLHAPKWTIWANPLGWMTETRPASGNNWWPLLYALAFTALALGVAFLLQSRRDFGLGVVAQNPGPARGTIRSTWGLALRLNTGPIITWLIAFATLGVVFGYFATSIRDLLGEDSTVAELLAAGALTHKDLVSSFIVTILSMVGIIAAVPGVQTMLKVRSEELEDRVEPILSTPTSRFRYYGSNVLLALTESVVYVLVAGVIMAAVAANSDIGVSFWDVFIQAAATVPAVWTVVAVAVAVVGARPRASLAAWLGVVASFALTILGPMFNLWDWILGISPFWHIPNVTAAPVDWSGLGWISLFTLGFIAVGFIGFRRRDIAR